ncbi:TIGR03618 family F420-dependent PPOX class oxidoreductase [Luteimicrobium xylanilyticum]|uniref:Pyridoxamine 5'-phosphate oxidase N-terminal domain-containing protein n=1 Tax=Luteimicrobium xylanilyticum TaxID=1133546 RepID=A0A5P9QAC5_9MICO|nr:uncharacterized protein KDY119_01518 [Luteimicrobium xylanilyticum]
MGNPYALVEWGFVVHLNPEQRVFVTERHLATLTTLRDDGSPHVVPVAFTWDDDAGVVRITTNRGSVKARNAARRTHGAAAPRASVCQVEGGRWITLEGPVEVVPDLEEIVDAVARYARRYRPLEPNPDRVVLRIAVDKVMSSAYMAG